MLVGTFQLMRRNAAVFAAYLVCLCLVPVLDDLLGNSAGGRGAQFVITFFLLRSVQQMVLAHGSPQAIDYRGSLGFMARHFAILATSVAIAIIPLIAFGYTPGALLLMIALIVVVYPFFLALVGTWPMSNIVPDGITLLAAFRCGSRRLATTYGRLLLATVLPLLLVLVLAFKVAEPHLYLDGKFNPLGVVTDLLGQAAQLVGLTYTAVVLTRKYLDAAPSPDRWNDGVTLAT